MAVSPVDAGSLVGERLGKYQLLALIAIGGTAEIYLARIGGEAGFEKYVVVKCLLDHLADDTDFVRMFLDEARLCAQLDHSNIVQTLELGQHEGRYYMVMEHLAGMSLAQLARKTHERVAEGVIPTRIVLGLAAQACAGLHYAHQRTGNDGTQLNVVHRDVSPQNLVVTFEGMLKIVDFGIAKADMRQTHTRSGTIKGKFAYMSPEQCLAEPIDRRTDVFALGTVVHELLTARRLFKRVNTYETYQAILKGNAPPPSRYNATVDEDLDQVVLRALAYQKEDRFESTEAFGEAMLAWLHSHGQSVSASDVARYVEKVCAPEIDEHAAHMRELISGHRLASGEGLRWDVASAEEEAESKSLGASPLGTESALGLDITPGRPGDPDDPSDFDDDDPSSQEIEASLVPRGPQDDEDFAGDTQIELDPMERVAALEAEAAAAAAFRVPDPARGGRGAGPAAGGSRGQGLVPSGTPSGREGGPDAASGRARDAARMAPAGGRSAPGGRTGAGGSAGPPGAMPGAEAGRPGAPRATGPSAANAARDEGLGRGGGAVGGGPGARPGGPGPGASGHAALGGAGVGGGAGAGMGAGPGPAPGASATPRGARPAFPPASLRPRLPSSSGAPARPGEPPPAPGRRSANEPTSPEMDVGPGAAHDALTIPASDMVSDPDSSPGGDHPGYPGQPGGPSPAWTDDSAEVLRHGRPPMPPHGPSPYPPGPGNELPLHAQPTILRPPPGMAMGPPMMRSPARPQSPPVWLLALAFVLSAGVGLGLTVLIGSLIT
jgi:serine/threonine protein kinase